MDWADGSTFLGASQNGTGLIFPYIQVKDRAGDWQTVIQDMGIPSGKPKTIVGGSHGQVSVRRHARFGLSPTCACTGTRSSCSKAPMRRRFILRRIDASTADLHFRGFSKVVIDAATAAAGAICLRSGPTGFELEPNTGRYTRYGDVGRLVTAVDDRLLIMGSGDEAEA